MKKTIAGIFGITMFAFAVNAQLTYEGGYPVNQPLQEYFSAQEGNENKSIIYIFYNGDECYQCPQTIALTEQIYNDYYADAYSLFVIDYANDEEYDFIRAYNLNEPLAIVLVLIEDGRSLGYRKISNPQNLIEAQEDYTQYLTQSINDFLGADGGD